MTAKRPLLSFLALLAGLSLVSASCTYRPLRGERPAGSAERSEGAPTAEATAAVTPTLPPASEGLPPPEATNAAPTARGGVVVTLAGSTKGYAEGTGAAAQFAVPTGVAVDGSGTVYVADTLNHRIRKIAADGTTSTLAGTGTAGSLDGPGNAAQFSSPRGVAVDEGGTVYVADTGNNKVRVVAPDGTTTTLAGSGKAGFANAPDRKAQFSSPVGIAVGAGNTLYVSEFGNNAVRRVSQTGQVTTLAGSGKPGNADGKGAAASFDGPYGISTDAAGNIYVADTGNNRIRKITPDGTVTTSAGSEAGFLDGNAGTARFNGPQGVAVGPDGSLYVADFGNSVIRLIDAKGKVSTIAGSTTGFADGAAASAKFNRPQGISLGRKGVVYVADSGNNRVRRIDPARAK